MCTVSCRSIHYHLLLKTKVLKMSAIEIFLSKHSEYDAFEVFEPENCALCIYNNQLVHILVDENCELIDSEVLEEA